ncbi:hypothetical protein BFS06_11400 [Clostridium perfringens]|uniref:leucine-rich repeat domain-containing protein n=1 Tax=Clostridium perfringens TaxID=1502 RepID=UPI00103991A3|nr:leucine-rich repeat domain-containing protein [Clostridium perfringens]TBX14820.1 hypothetical protein BFS06_11400 [Clostridium perfringens]
MKKNKIQNILYSKGYVSIEALIVAGLIIATGAFLISKLVWKGKDIATTNNNNMTVASKTMDDNSFIYDETVASSLPLDNKVNSECSLENPLDLADYEYRVIDDDFINQGLDSIDKMFNSSDFVEPIEDIKPSSSDNLSSNSKSNLILVPNASGEMMECTKEEVVKMRKESLERLREFKGGVMILDYHGNKTDIEIPSCIDGKKVVIIAPKAFSSKTNFVNRDIDRPFDESEMPRGNIKSVKIPKTIKSIGSGAFEANHLSEIFIPDSVVEIGEEAFKNNDLEKVIISNNVKVLNYGVFENNKLKSVIVPNNITYIGYDAFSSNELTDVKISNNVTKIGNSAFSNNKLISVIIPNSVLEIGNRAFAENQLKSLILGNSVKSIGSSAFNENQLTSVIIPNSVNEIKEFAFQDNKLTEIKIPASVTKIGRSVFMNNSLVSVTMPKKFDNDRDYYFGKDNKTPWESEEDYERFTDISNIKFNLI